MKFLNIMLMFEKVLHSMPNSLHDCVVHCVEVLCLFQSFGDHFLKTCRQKKCRHKIAKLYTRIFVVQVEPMNQNMSPKKCRHKLAKLYIRVFGVQLEP